MSSEQEQEQEQSVSLNVEDQDNRDGEHITLLESERLCHTNPKYVNSHWKILMTMPVTADPIELEDENKGEITYSGTTDQMINEESVGNDLNVSNHDSVNITDRLDDYCQMNYSDGKQIEEEIYATIKRNVEDDCGANNGLPVASGTLWRNEEREGIEAEYKGCRFHTHKHYHEEILDDTSLWILARVKRLEERFQCMQNARTLYSNNQLRSKQGTSKDAFASDELTRWNSYLREELKSKETQCSKAHKQVKLAEDSVKSKLRGLVRLINLKGLAYDRINKDATQQSDPSSTDREGHGMNINEAFHNQASIAEAGDAGECVHDVYEVKYETSDIPFVQHSNSVVGREYGKKEEVFKEEEGIVLPDENQTLWDNPKVVDPLDSLDSSLTEVKCTQKEDIEDGKNILKLKEKLKVLQEERQLMKKAIDSLIKENKDLKLLQAIAQDIVDIKGETHKLPLVSFFKVKICCLLSLVLGSLYFVFLVLGLFLVFTLGGG